MKRERTIEISFSVLLFVAAMTFWAGVHPEWLSFHEQYQMFLLTGDYLSELIAPAGGVADYAAEFVVQFFLFPWLGAALMAAIIVGIQLSVWSIAKKIGADTAHYPISLIPSLLIIAYAGNQNAMPTYFVSILMALIATRAYYSIRRKREYWQIALIPIIYWATGYSAVIYVALTSIYEIAKGNLGRKSIIATAANIAILVAIVEIAKYTWMIRYTAHDIIMGVNNYRERLAPPNMQHIIAIAMVAAPIIMTLVSKAKKQWLMWIEAMIVVGTGAWATTQYNTKIYHLLKFDYFVRNERWNAVINYAKKNMEPHTIACTAVNLALGMRGELIEKMFDFYQIDQQGLLTRFDRNMVSCTVTAEACYHLGLINSAMRYNYDLQESIDNRRKSSRFTKRIAEGYLVNGRYEAAKKHLKRLSKTMFYAKWAKDAMTYLGDEDRINEHPVWGKLRRYQLEEDELFSISDMDILLCDLFKHCQDNTMALDYGLACTLANNNLKRFGELYPLSQMRKTPYKIDLIGMEDRR